MTIHASKARFKRWESIVTQAMLVRAYENALLLEGYTVADLIACAHPAECATCRTFALYDSPTVHMGYGGTD